MGFKSAKQSSKLIKAKTNAKIPMPKFGMAAGGLPIIAIGPQGGKIVGYKGAKHTPIYADSSDAAKLLHQKQTVGDNAAPIATKALAWLAHLGFHIGEASAANGNVYCSKELAKKLEESFGLTAIQAPTGPVFPLVSLLPHIGHALKPHTDDLKVWMAQHAAGGIDAKVVPDEMLPKLKQAGPLPAGSHPGFFVDGPGGLKLVFKYEADGSVVIPHAAEAALRIAQLVFPDPSLYPKAEVVTFDGKVGVLETFLEGKTLDSTGGGDEKHGINSDVMQKHVLRLVQHQVVDWLVSNHDSHGGNFMLTPHDDLAAFDKGQSWKFIKNDELSTTYGPNPSQPAYNKMWQAIASGDLVVEPAAVIDAAKAVLDNVAKLSMEQLHSIMLPYLEAIASQVETKGGTFDANAKWGSIKNRFMKVREQWETFLSNTLGQPVKFGDASPTTPLILGADFNVATDETALTVKYKDVLAVPAGPSSWQPVDDVEEAIDAGLQKPAPIIVKQPDEPQAHPLQMPGWPIKVGNATMHHPGAAAPSGVKWPGAYPGPGAHIEVEYKGQPWHFKFGVANGALDVEVKFPNGTVKHASSPQQAADFTALFSKGLSLDLTATEKKAAGIAYPATKMMQVAAFQAAVEKVKGLPETAAMNVDQLKDEQIVHPTAKTLTLHDIVAALPDGVVTEMSGLPAAVQAVANTSMSESPPVSSGMKGGTVVKLAGAGGEQHLVVAHGGYYSTSHPYLLWTLAPDGSYAALGEAHSFGGGFPEVDAVLLTAEAKAKAAGQWIEPAPVAAPEPVVVPEPAYDPKTHPKTEADYAALPQGTVIQPLHLQGAASGKWTKHGDKWWSGDHLENADNAGMTGGSPDVVIGTSTKPPPAAAYEAQPAPVAYVPTTPTEAPHAVVKQTKKGLGEVELKVFGEKSFAVTIPGTEHINVPFKSLGAACDHVWSVQQGFKDAAAWKAHHKNSKVPSGSGWKFWGLSGMPAIPVPVAPLEPVAAPVAEVAPAPPEPIAPLPPKPEPAPAPEAASTVEFSTSDFAAMGVGTTTTFTSKVGSKHRLAKVAENKWTHVFVAADGTASAVFQKTDSQAAGVVSGHASQGAQVTVNGPPGKWLDYKVPTVADLQALDVGDMLSPKLDHFTSWQKTPTGFWHDAENNTMFSSAQFAAELGDVEYGIMPAAYVAAPVDSGKKEEAPSAPVIPAQPSLQGAPMPKLHTAASLPAAVKKATHAFAAVASNWLTSFGGKAGHSLAEKSPLWPDWVPPPGIWLEGEYNGKKVFFTSSASGYLASGDPASLMSFMVVDEEGASSVVHGHTDGFAGLSAAVGAVVPNHGETFSQLTLTSIFDLDGASFPANKTSETLQTDVPSAASAIAKPVDEIPPEVKQQTVNLALPVIEAIHHASIKEKYGTFEVQSGGKYLVLKSTSFDDAIKNLNAFVADHGLKPLLKWGANKSKYQKDAAYISVNQAALDHVVTIQTSVLEAASEPPTPAPLPPPSATVQKWPGDLALTDALTLESAPVGTMLSLAYGDEHQLIKLSSGGWGWMDVGGNKLLPQVTTSEEAVHLVDAVLHVPDSLAAAMVPVLDPDAKPTLFPEPAPKKPALGTLADGEVYVAEDFKPYTKEEINAMPIGQLFLAEDGGVLMLKGGSYPNYDSKTFHKFSAAYTKSSGMDGAESIDVVDGMSLKHIDTPDEFEIFVEHIASKKAGTISSKELKYLPIGTKVVLNSGEEFWKKHGTYWYPTADSVGYDYKGPAELSKKDAVVESLPEEQPFVPTVKSVSKSWVKDKIKTALDALPGGAVLKTDKNPNSGYAWQKLYSGKWVKKVGEHWALADGGFDSSNLTATLKSSYTVTVEYPVGGKPSKKPLSEEHKAALAAKKEAYAAKKAAEAKAAAEKKAKEDAAKAAALEVAKQKAAAAKVKAAALKKVQEWAKAHTTSDPVLLKSLAYMKKALDEKVPGVTKGGVYAIEHGGMLLLGSDAGDAFAGAVAQLGFHTVPVDTPAGKLFSVNPSSIKSIYKTPLDVVGPDGKTYPPGSTFKTETTETTKQQLLESDPEFSGKIEPNLKDPTAAVWKAAGTDDDNVEKVKAKLAELGLTSTGVQKGGKYTLAFLKNKAELDVVAKTETKLIVDSPKTTEPKFTPKGVAGEVQAQKEVAVENYADLASFDAVKPSGWGHAVRMGDPGVLRGCKIVMKKVVLQDGSEVVEVFGDLTDFDHTKSKLKSGKLHFNVHDDATHGGGYDPETGKHVLAKSATKKGPFGAYEGTTGGGSSIHVGNDDHGAIRNHFVVRIPAGADYESEIREALSLAVGEDNAERCMLPHDAALEKKYIKAQMVRAGIGVGGLWDYTAKYGKLDPKKYGDEDWLDEQLKLLKLTDHVDTAMIEVGPGNVHHVVMTDLDDKLKASSVKFVSTALQSSVSGDGANIIAEHLGVGVGVPSRRTGYISGTSRSGGGASATADDKSGGATGLMSMVAFDGDSASSWGNAAFIYHPRVLRRADYFSHPGDGYGSTSPQHASHYGATYTYTTGEAREAVIKSNGTGETCFFDGVAMADVMGVACQTDSIYAHCVKTFQKRWPEQTHIKGVPVKDFFFVGYDEKTILQKSLLAKEPGL